MDYYGNMDYYEKKIMKCKDSEKKVWILDGSEDGFMMFQTKTELINHFLGCTKRIRNISITDAKALIKKEFDEIKKEIKMEEKN